MKVRAGLVLLAIVVIIMLTLPAIKVLVIEGEAPAIVPAPQSIERHRGFFTLGPETRVMAGQGAHQTAEYLAEQLRKSTGLPLPMVTAPDSKAENDIVITTNAASRELGEEGYELNVSPSSASIRASASAGLFDGAQSLLQLLPPDIFTEHALPGRRWKIPCVRIQDKPRFAWRGLMLDESRHFFSKDELKKLLRTMALHKLNVFHWHLTDDQGWRIEIKRYPRLTEVGAWRKNIGFNLEPKSSTAYGADGRYGGYYTQADVRELVAYAQALHITIVPEIEMPGHSSAALAAYPELSCSGGPYYTDMSSNTSAGVFCAGKDETFEFLDNVLTEVMALFPGKYIHIGGDEVPKQNWKDCPRCQARSRSEGLKNERELQSYFVQRIGKFISTHGRTPIGWSEIREGGIPEQAALMDWIGGAAEAATSGHDVVRSPDAYCYFDFYQSKNRAAEPAAVGGCLPLEKVYSFEPLPENLGLEFKSHILGSQANVWTEYIASLPQVEYMTFPRLCALAEVVWSPKDSRNWNDFTRRLRIHLQRLDRLGVNYRRKADWEAANR